MYFRNKFDEEFLLLANNISPKGGKVRLSNSNPLFFEFIKPAFDDTGRYIMVIPLLLYNHIYTSFSETSKSNDITKKDKVVEDWVVLCENRKDCEIVCEEIDKVKSEQNTDKLCDMNISTLTGDIYKEPEDDPDYDYEVS